MANDHHLSILYAAHQQQDITIWNNWRKANPQIIPDFYQASLQDMDLFGANLRDADLREARLIRSDLSSANLIDADLSYAVLERTTLRDATLSRADCYHVDMRAADLSEADLYATELTNAILIGANLTQANLREADMRQADMRETNLIGADLSRSIVHNADFTDATFGNTILGAINLSSAKGLESLNHSAPSTIGVDTLYQSGGHLPQIFLRGCGVPDTMIAFVQSLVGAAIDYYNCFVSYSRKDEDFARLLVNTLQGVGIRCWLAPEQILPQKREASNVNRGILYWDKVLFCASQNSLQSDWWGDYTTDGDNTEQVGELIPLNLDGFMFSDAYTGEIFEPITVANFVGWRTNLDIFNREVRRVIRAVRASGGLRYVPPPS